MPDYKPNQIVRAFAVLALIAALVLVVLVIATSGGSSGSDSGKSGHAHKSTVTREGRRALHKGFWIVHSGDTLLAISLETGVDQATLEQLNPDIDPQTLLQGQRIALR
jgi:hypothetical protein